MDEKRAQEIASSPNMINVTYEGTPVYIEYVNENSKTARVHYLEDAEDAHVVSLSSLIEH